MNHWLIASYKINELKRLIVSLENQNFRYYLPKIVISNFNSAPKEEALFPGYVFVNTSIENYSHLKFTRGIKDVIKFGDSISHMTDNDIKSIKMIEKASKYSPVNKKIFIGQEAIITQGALEGSIVEICSLPSKERVAVLLSILGSNRKINISINNLEFD